MTEPLILTGAAGAAHQDRREPELLDSMYLIRLLVQTTEMRRDQLSFVEQRGMIVAAVPQAIQALR